MDFGLGLIEPKSDHFSLLRGDECHEIDCLMFLLPGLRYHDELCPQTMGQNKPSLPRVDWSGILWQ